MKQSSPNLQVVLVALMFFLSGMDFARLDQGMSYFWFGILTGALGVLNFWLLLSEDEEKGENA